MRKNAALDSNPNSPAMATDRPARRRDPYLVKSVVHASEILGAFHNEEEALTLKEVVNRCKLPKSMVFRLLYTMERCAIVHKVAQNLYRSTVLLHHNHPADPAPIGTNGDSHLLSPPA